MTSSRPYLVRAMYEWIVDNDCTPYVLVDAYAPGVQVPQQYVEDGQIVLNIAPGAVASMELGNHLMRFNARFGGVPTDVLVPVAAIRGLYARENGRGMVFDEDEPPTSPPTDPDDSDPDKKPSLRVVK
jgi:stringent starvation protein B